MRIKKRSGFGQINNNLQIGVMQRAGTQEAGDYAIVNNNFNNNPVVMNINRT